MTAVVVLGLASGASAQGAQAGDWLDRDDLTVQPASFAAPPIDLDTEEPPGLPEGPVGVNPAPEALAPAAPPPEEPQGVWLDTPLLKGTYTRGPLTYRCVYSYGVYDNPYGRQGMWVPGITAQITSNLTLWFEYTYWDSRTGSSPDAVLENGYQMIVDWHF